MYNDPYYSRRGRTIERKKTASGHVIQPELVPVYYNYFKDNGLLPAPPPAPPVHVDDGKCIAVDYDNQEYSFPEVLTNLTNVLGTMLSNLGIDVDITKVDHVILSIYLVGSSADDQYGYFNHDTRSINPLCFIGTYNGSGSTDNPYTLTFVRDYSSSDISFYATVTTGDYSPQSYLNIVTPGLLPYAFKKNSSSVSLLIRRIVVATLTE